MKKCLSVILSAMLTLSSLTQGFVVGAAATASSNSVNTSTNMNTTASEFELSGKNSLGNILADELKGATEETAESLENESYGIFDLSMSGNIASVTYYAKIGATLVVALYNEEGTQLLASGTHEIITTDDAVENLTTEITIEGYIPEYYLVKTFILDENQMPLCDEYICELYTEDITKVRESVISDYDPELVINLDESEETNFLVLHETTKQIEYNGTTNTLESADEES